MLFASNIHSIGCDVLFLQFIKTTILVLSSFFGHRAPYLVIATYHVLALLVT